MIPRLDPAFAASQAHASAEIHTLRPVSCTLPKRLDDLLMFLRFLETHLVEAANKPADIRAGPSDDYRKTELLLDLQNRAAWKATLIRARSLSEIRCKLEIWEIVAAEHDGAGGELGVALVGSIKRDLDTLS